MNSDPLAPIPSGKQRLYYLDNLRSFVILVVVVFHAAMAYMLFAPTWWPVIDTQQSLFFTALVILTDVPIMPIMFMIAGYFGIASLASKGQGRFWKDKFLRIILPWVVGFLVVAPTSPYLWLVSRHKDPGFAYFWLHLFFTKTFSTQGALWFLGVLTVFYALLSLAYAMMRSLGSADEKASRPGLGFVLLFWLVPCAVFVFINQFWYDFAWVPVKYLLWVQPTRVSLEAFYFALGVYAYRKRWFGSGGYRPSPALWLPLAISAGAVFLVYKLHFNFLMPQLPVRVGHGLLHCLFCLSTTFAVVGLCARYMDRTSSLLARLSAGSYAIYWVHMPIVLLCNLAFVGYHWNLYLKYLVVSLLSLVFSFLVGAYGLAWLPMFAGKNANSGPQTTSIPAMEETLKAPPDTAELHELLRS